MTERSEETEIDDKKGGLFEDLSISQVVAGALAAVTALLLSSKIGITGSVIGVALASVVSTVSSQLYKKFLSSSAQKIKDGIQQTTVIGKHSAGAAAGSEDVDSASNETQITEPLPRAERAQRADVSGHSLDAELAHRRKLQRTVIIVSIVSSLIVVVLSAVIINLSTQGEGIGTKPAPIIVASSDTQSTDATSVEENAQTTSDAAATTTSQETSLPSSQTAATDAQNTAASTASTTDTTTGTQAENAGTATGTTGTGETSSNTAESSATTEGGSGSTSSDGNGSTAASGTGASSGSGTAGTATA